MGSLNLKRSVSSAKAGLVKFKCTVVGLAERMAGRPLTAKSKKKAAMSITRRSDYIRQVVHKVPAENVPADMSPAVIMLPMPRARPEFIEIAEDQPAFTSITVPVRVQMTIDQIVVPETVCAEDSTEDFCGFTSYCGNAAAVTSTATVAAQSTFCTKTFDQWDFNETSCDIEEDPVSEIEVPITDESAAVETDVPAIADVSEIEESAEEAFFKKLYSGIESYIIFNEILPSIEAEGMFQAPEYVIESIDSNEEECTVIEISEPAEEMKVDDFVNGSVSFSFGFPVAAAQAGSTNFSFIMGVQEDEPADEDIGEMIHTGNGSNPVMAEPVLSGRVYL